MSDERLDYLSESISDLERKVSMLESDRDRLAEALIKVCELVLSDTRFTAVVELKDLAEEILQPYRL